MSTVLYYIYTKEKRACRRTLLDFPVAKLSDLYFFSAFNHRSFIRHQSIRYSAQKARPRIKKRDSKKILVCATPVILIIKYFDSFFRRKTFLQIKINESYMCLNERFISFIFLMAFINQPDVNQCQN